MTISQRFVDVGLGRVIPCVIRTCFSRLIEDFMKMNYMQQLNSWYVDYDIVVSTIIYRNI